MWKVVFQTFFKVLFLSAFLVIIDHNLSGAITLSLPSEISTRPGEKVKVPISIDVDDLLAAFTIQLDYDPTFLKNPTVSISEALISNWSLTPPEITERSIKFGAKAPEGETIAFGKGTLAHVIFEVGDRKGSTTVSINKDATKVTTFIVTTAGFEGAPPKQPAFGNTTLVVKIEALGVITLSLPSELSTRTREKVKIPISIDVGGPLVAFTLQLDYDPIFLKNPTVSVIEALISNWTLTPPEITERSIKFGAHAPPEKAGEIETIAFGKGTLVHVIFEVGDREGSATVSINKNATKVTTFVGGALEQPNFGNTTLVLKIEALGVITLSLPSEEFPAHPGEKVTIPIKVDAGKSLGFFTIQLDYDPILLANPVISQSETLTKDWIYNPPEVRGGSIKFEASIFVTRVGATTEKVGTPVKGAGTLVNVIFDVKEMSGATNIILNKDVTNVAIPGELLGILTKELPNFGNTTLIIKIEPLPIIPGKISGIITDSVTNKPISGARILTDKGDYSAQSSIDGSYTISGVVPGTYTVTAIIEGYEPKSQRIEVKSDLTTEANLSLLPLTKGTIVGVITDSSTGAGVSGVTISAEPIKESSSTKEEVKSNVFEIVPLNNPFTAAAPANAGNFTTTTNPSGKYTLSDLPDGVYSLIASLVDREPQSQTEFMIRVTRKNVKVTPGSTVVEDMSITVLNPTGVIKGTVRDAITENGLGRAIIITDKGDYITVTNPDGDFIIPNVSPGVYTLTTSLKGYSSVSKGNVVVTVRGVARVSFSMNKLILSLSITPAALNLVIGQSEKFTASGGLPPYNWKVDSGLISSDVGAEVTYTAPGAPGKFSLTLTESGGNSTTAAISVADSLTLSPSSINLAPGESHSFTASGGGGQYTWQANKGTLSASSGTTVTYTAPNEIGIFTITATDNQKGISSARVVVSSGKLFIDPPRIDLTPGESKKFSVSGGTGGYTWEASGGKLDTTKGPVVTYTASNLAGSFTLTVTDSGGNKAIANVNTNIPLQVTPTRANLIPGASIVLKASGGSGDYKWQATGGILDKVTGPSVNYSAPSSIGTSTVLLSDAAGATDTVLINVTTLPAIIPKEPVLNQKGTQLFTVQGGIPPYSWITSEGSLSESAGTQVTFTAPRTAGNFILKVIDGGGNSDTVTVKVISPLTITPATAHLEPGQTQQFTLAGGTGSYKWQATHGSLSVKEGAGVTYIAPEEPGNYSLVALDAGQAGVSVTALITVTQGAINIDPPFAALSPMATQELTVNGGLPPYVWRASSGDLSSTTGSRVSFIAPAVAGNYEITVMDGQGKEAKAYINIGRPLQISPVIANLKPGDMQVFQAAGGTEKYSWTASVGELSDRTSPRVSFTGPKAEGRYQIILADSSGNSAISNVRVTANPLKIIPGTASIKIAESLPLAAEGGLPPYIFTTTGGNLSVQGNSAVYISPELGGNYQVTVFDRQGEKAIAQVTVESIAKGGNPRVTLSTNKPIYNPGDTFQLKINFVRGEQNNVVDTYFSFRLPDGSLLYLGPNLTPSPAPVPIIKSLEITSLLNVSLFSFPLDASVPAGEYVIAIIFTKPGEALGMGEPIAKDEVKITMVKR